MENLSPPRLTFTWSNRWKRFRGSENFTISWTSSEEPHTDTCQLLRVNGQGGARDVNCTDSRWISDSIALEEGEYILRVTTEDAYGNAGIYDAGFTVDVTPPEAVLERAPPTVANTEGHNRYFLITCSEANCRFEVAVLNHRGAPPAVTGYYYGPGNAYSFDVGALGLENGKTYTLQISVKDAAGNVGPTRTYNWTIDRTAPEVVVSNVASTVGCEAELSSVAKPNVTLRGASGKAGYQVTYADRIEECRVERTWTVIDSAGNSASRGQTLPMRVEDAELQLLPFLAINCDSSGNTTVVVPNSASVKSNCFAGHVPFAIDMREDVSSYPCPGSWTRRYTVRDPCRANQSVAAGNQTVRTVDVCPASACGRTAVPARGVCISGSCSCNRPWYGENCNVEIFEPRIEQPSAPLELEEGRDLTFTPNLLQGTAPVSWELISGPGMSSNFLSIPYVYCSLEIQGKHVYDFLDRLGFDSVNGTISLRRTDAGRLNVTVLARNSVGFDRLSLLVNVRATYNASLGPMAVDTFPSAQPVTLSGSVQYDAGSYIKQLLYSFVPIAVRVRHKKTGVVSGLSTFTKVDGTFRVVFNPPRTQYGAYEAVASHPRVPEAGNYTTDFNILGMRAVPKRARLDGETVGNFSKDYAGLIELENDGPKTLTNLTAEPLHRTNLENNGVQIAALLGGQGQLARLESGSKTPLTFNLTTKGAIRGSITIVIKSGEDTKTYLVLDVTIAQINPVLVVDPPNVKTRALRGGDRMIEFTVTNGGRVSATNLRALMPANQIIHVVGFGADGDGSGGSSSSSSLDLSVNSTATLTMRLAPPADHALGSFRGSFVLACAETRTKVPFELIVSSTVITNFTVVVEDEYTYFSSPNFPLVNNSEVRIINHLRRIDITKSTSELNGRVTFEDLVEDRYDLYVQAPDHLSVSRVVVPSPDGGDYKVFLRRQAVKYSWSVRKKRIEDKYEIKLETSFVTRVPMPVVTIEPTTVDLEPYELGYESSIAFNVTNQGLIRADALSLTMPTGHPFLEFDSFPELGDLEAQTSILVTVGVRRKSVATTRSGDDCRPLPIGFSFQVCCNGDRNGRSIIGRIMIVLV